MRPAFAQADINDLIMGAGLDLAVRLEIIGPTLTASDKTTVQVKDSIRVEQLAAPYRVGGRAAGLQLWEAIRGVAVGVFTFEVHPCGCWPR